MNAAPRPAGVVVVGPVMADVLARLHRGLAVGTDTPSTVVTGAGGAGANVAAWLATTGTPVSLLCRVGDDPAGTAAVRTLTEAGVRVRARLDPAAATGTCVVLVAPDGERSMLPDQAANARLDAHDLPADEFVPGRHLHLSGYVLLLAGARAAGLHALTLARAAGMTTSVDPASTAMLAEVGPADFTRWVHGVDVLLPNADEARMLAGLPGVEQSVRALGGTVGAVACTLGDAGALWYRADTGFVQEPARANDVVDTTGAGDAFTAGFLGGWLTSHEPAAALRSGCDLAANAVSVLGAQPAAHSPGPANRDE